jgi:hypothetical protein
MPYLDTVYYSGAGTWVAWFGYYNPNSIAITKPVGTDNGFTYLGTNGLNKGQPTNFSPGSYPWVFSVSFNGSKLSWTLDSTTIYIQTTYPMKIEMKDNGIGESNISKPQIRVTNLGTQTISGFKLRLWFSRAEYFSQFLVVDKYYMNPSTITLSKGVHPKNPNIIFVDINYPTSFQLAPGARTTDDGVQLGVHFNNYYPGQWTKLNDWSWQGITGSFSETQKVTIYDQYGNLFYGSEPDSQQTLMPPNISTAEVFGFEKLGGWIAPAGTNSLNSTNKTQGSYSLKISNGGYQTINSIDMSTSKITGVLPKIKVDLFIGPSQPNPSWYGTLQLYVNCPSANVNDTYLGQCELTGLQKNAFNTLTFTIPSNIQTLLTQNPNPTDFSFKWTLNTNSNSGPYSFDNMRFSN